MTAEALFARWRDRIESQLDAALPSPAEAPQRLHQAMRYSVLGGGIEPVQRCAEHLAGGIDQQGAHALAATEHGMAHRLVQALRGFGR